MSKIAHYLQEHLLGEVLTAADVRKYFSTDAGIFTVTPQMVVYPRSESDVRKTARFTWQLAERGRTMPITARGYYSSLALPFLKRFLAGADSTLLLAGTLARLINGALR